MLLDTHEITRGVSMARRRYRRSRTCVQVFVIHHGRNPDRRNAHAFDTSHFLLNFGQVATPIGMPIRLRGVEQARALRRIIVTGVAVKETGR